MKLSRQSRSSKIILSRNSSEPAPEYGFTLIEVLASSVILVIAVAGAIVAFNLITQSVRGTGIRAEQSRAIDEDIALISDISERFTSCVDPAGSALEDPTDCAGAGVDVEFPNSFYYFPDDPDGIDDFFAACRGGALRTNFIAEVGGPVDLEAGVRRLAPVPVNQSDHVVSIRWVDSTRADLRQLREAHISPVVAAWCP